MPEPETSPVLDLLGLSTTTTTTTTLNGSGVDRGVPAPRPARRRRWVWAVATLAAIGGLVTLRLTVGASSQPNPAAKLDTRWCAAWQDLITYSKDQRPTPSADGSAPSGATYLAYLDHVADLNGALLAVSPPALADAHRALHDYSTAQTSAAHQRYTEAGDVAFMSAVANGDAFTTATFPIEAFKVLNTYQKQHCD